MARQLCAAGERVSQLLLMDTWRPTRDEELRARWIDTPRHLVRGYRAEALLAVHEIAAAFRSGLAGGRGLRRLRAGAGAARRQLRVLPDRIGSVGAPYPGQNAGAERNYTRVIARYRPGPVPIPVTLVASADCAADGIADGWADLTPGGLSVHAITGVHRSYLNDEDTMVVLSRLLTEAFAP